tara:strand:- start:115 stop:588 length:474 start_codon:yes stop_codon:yes gene_type:complete
MLITIIYIGSSNNLFQDVVRDYEKRIKNLGRSIGLKEIIYKEIKNSNKKNATGKKDEETKKLIGQKEKEAVNILLDIEGSKLNSVEFSEYILDQANINQNINFFIGGSEGIDRKYFGDFDKIISFGDLTWPHKMFKMMLLEQIYRSITIINKHPYHK